MRRRGVIPTAIVAGLIVGRWWAIPLIGLAWAAWILIEAVCAGWCFAQASLLGAANAAVGVAMHRGARHLLMRNR